VLAQGWNALAVNGEYFQFGTSWTSINGRNSLDNNTYALSTLLPMSLAAALAIYTRNVLARGVLGMILGLQVHQVLLMNTRGGMLSLIVLFLLGCYFMPKRWDTMVGATLVLSAGLILAGPMVVKRFQSIFADETKRDESAESRFELWLAGWRIMCDYPVLGVGVFAGERMVPKYTQFSKDVDKALHNLFFDIGTGTGFLGVSSFLLFFYWSWQAARRIQAWKQAPEFAHVIALAVLAGLPAYWFGSMFSSSALIESPYIACALVVSVEAILVRRGRSMPLIESESDRYL
jgi:O-antigen ligase